MEPLRFTLGTFIDKIEENGLPHIVGKSFRSDDPKQGACALGQAYWNLVGNPETIDFNHEKWFWDEFSRETEQKELFSRNDEAITTATVNLNDTKRLSLEEIVTELRILYQDKLDTEIVINEFTTVE